jgi:hypothetical protein
MQGDKGGGSMRRWHDVGWWREFGVTVGKARMVVSVASRHSRGPARVRER